nr:Chain C, Spike protein S1 peptide [Severe acute respiratory syndrome coronavirus 2]
NSASFSTFK